MIRIELEQQRDRTYWSIWVYNDADGTCAKPAELEFVKPEDVTVLGAMRPQPTFQLSYDMVQRISNLVSRNVKKQVKAEISDIEKQISKAIAEILRGKGV